MSKKNQNLRTLELFPEIGATVTPTEIDVHVGGTGSYFSKRICYLKQLGFKFDVKKDGRNIVSYTLTGEPENVSYLRNGVQSRKNKKDNLLLKKNSDVKSISPSVETLTSDAAVYEVLDNSTN